ncbi:hypothetical protein PR048_033788 [Dryococelus australis]|uniref:Endonuclease/exonuclease/phosphatase domain-containing protein n=1 Tax=Dryococelus australis TaxID=614101 RepID=A0ABQ9G2B3_9NEOP|nr:hypothetical protein PR048_033788 [Dryococelus australis]
MWWCSVHQPSEPRWLRRVDCMWASKLSGLNEYLAPMRCYKCQGLGPPLGAARLKSQPPAAFVELRARFNTCPQKRVWKARGHLVQTAAGGATGPTDHQATARACPIMERSITLKEIINLQRSSGVSAELAALLSDPGMDADILLVQEPYSVRGGSQDCEKSRNGCNGIKPSVPTHTMCFVQITKPLGRRDIIVSSYFQHQRHRDTSIRWACGRQCQRRTRHSPTTNARETSWTEFVLAHDLHVANQAGQPSTFVSDSCGSESNIDVHWPRCRPPGKLADWVVTYDSSSDHRLIRFFSQPSRAN